MGRYASATYLIAMVTKLPWQPQLYVNNSFVLSWIESIFGIEVLWEDRHQPHTSLLWYLCYHSNHSDMSITLLSQVILSSHLVWRFFGTIGISLIPRCYGNLVTMAARVKHQ